VSIPLLSIKSKIFQIGKQTMEEVNPEWEVFAVLDKSEAYLQFAPTDESKQYMAVWEPDGRISTWNAVPYGFAGMPAFYNEVMEKQFAALKELVRYFDDEERIGKNWQTIWKL